MHILILPSWYKTLDEPVKGTFFEEQARSLMEQSHKVGIICFNFLSFSSKKESVNEQHIDNHLITKFLTFRALLPYNRKFNYWLLCVRANKVFKQYCNINGKPQIIHAHSVFYGGIIANYLSKKNNIPYVITEHLTNFITNKLNNTYDIQISKKIFTKAKQTIVVSSDFKEKLSEKLNLPRSVFMVISNTVSTLFYETFCVNPLSLKEPIIFFTSSFITERKNHMLIINAFAHVLKGYPTCMLYIGGYAATSENTVYLDSLKQLCINLNIQHQVLFLGKLSREETKKYMDKCHAFLLASFYETFGVVLIEALACGRPVISTNSGGPLDIVTPSNGIIVSSFEVKDFKNAMCSLIENYTFYHPTQIRENCISAYGSNAIAYQLQNCYQQFIYS